MSEAGRQFDNGDVVSCKQPEEGAVGNASAGSSLYFFVAAGSKLD